jgi:glycosyltransferase involved in cell wall biosynthesis
MCKLYNAADCYLSPYLAEGFNLPALESIACGTPVIVSKGGPTDDFTDDRVAKYPRTFSVQSGEEAVLLVDEGSLQDEMLSMIRDERFRKRAKKCGPELVALKFTWTHVAEMLYNFFVFITPEVTPNMTSRCRPHFSNTR